MAKKNLINNARGSRGVRDVNGVLTMIEPGQTVSIDVDAAELKDVKAIGITVAGAGAKADDDDKGGEGTGPLDGTLDDLKAHLETVDAVEDLDALGTAEAAGKARVGALNAIQARRDAIEAANESDGA